MMLNEGTKMNKVKYALLRIGHHKDSLWLIFLNVMMILAFYFSLEGFAQDLWWVGYPEFFIALFFFHLIIFRIKKMIREATVTSVNQK